MRVGFERYDCPFPPCDARWWRKPGSGLLVPPHAPQGEAAEPWVGTEAEAEDCPASGMFIDEVSRELVRADEIAKLDRASRQWRIATRIKEELAALPEEEQARRNEAMPTDPVSRFLGFPLGKREHGVDPTAFPERRGDPGAPDKDWKPKATVLPLTQIGQPLGRAAMSNAHATTQQLLTLTEQKLDEALGALGKVPDIADTLDGIVTQIAIHVDAAVALATATVGSGDSAPAAAGAMVAYIRDAQAKASVEDGGDLPAALTRFVRAATDITQFIAAAQESAREYHRALGGN